MFRPVEQTGNNCKIVAIANIDRYFTHQQSGTFPLHKQKTHFFSIRELAKAHGSIQGELLEAQQASSMLHELGYEVAQVSQHLVTNYLLQGYLIFACFAVDRSKGTPSVDFDGGNEHAAVIYHIDEDALSMMHWGKTYKTSFQLFVQSNANLPPTRQAAFFRRIADREMKYDVCNPGEAGAIKTLIPGSCSGFKGLYLAVKPNPTRFITARSALLTDKLIKSLAPYHFAEFAQLSSALSQGKDTKQALLRFEQAYAAHRIYYQCWRGLKVLLGLLTIALVLPWVVFHLLHQDMRALFFQDNIHNCFQATLSYKAMLAL